MGSLSGRPLRVLHAPLDIGGHASALCRAERVLGLDSHLLLARPDPRAPETQGSVSPPGFAGGWLPTPGVWRARQRFLDWVLAEVDALHFNFGRTLLDFPYVPGFELKDLACLKAAGKRVLVTFQGCDARDKWDHLRDPEWSACPGCRVPWCGLKSLLRRPRLAAIRRHADHVFILNPDLGRRLPGAQFLPYAIPSAADTVGDRAPRPPSAGRPLRVVHAPTDRAIKGTAHLLAVVERLRGQGLALELDLVEGVSRREVLARIAAADLAVDQLLIGWYGGFAVEAMALGLPTLCRIDTATATGLVDPALMADLPLVPADPGTLAGALADLAQDPTRRMDLAARGRAFAASWHAPERVAARVIPHYLG